MNYRTPSEVMDLAGRVLAVTDPHLRQPRSVRSLPPGPQAVPAGPGRLTATAVEVAARLAGDAGTVALICAPSSVEAVGAALDAAGVEHGEASRQGIEQTVSLVGVDVAKGLEFDAVVVVEPSHVADETGMRSLYVALTRATKRLVLVHERPLPDVLRRGMAVAG